MPFSPSVKQEALVRSRRSCCVCQEFAGRATEVHHILPEAEGGSNGIDNAIVLCLRCHVEASHYNDSQPLGNKYSRAELRRLRDEWWAWCKNNQAVPLEKHPISISPETIFLPAGARTLLKIYNKDKKPRYQVWVKLTIDTPNIGLRDIDIEAENLRGMYSARAGPIEASGDILEIVGTDQVDKKFISVMLASLDPGETRTFILRNASSRGSSTPKDIRILVGVWNFDTTPGLLIQKGDNRVDLQLPPLPESIRMEGVGWLLKRIA